MSKLILNTDEVDSIVLGDYITGYDVVNQSPWEPVDKKGKIDKKTFVISKDKLYSFTITRKYIESTSSTDEETGEVKKTKAGYIYSHETDGFVELKEVNKVCVKENGRRIIKYV